MAEREEKFLAELQDENADVRFAAWRRAGEMDPEVVPSLGKLLGADNPGVVKAATESLNAIVHSVGKDPADPRRAAVVKRLLDLAGDGQQQNVRALAFRWLSNVAGEDVVGAIAKFIHQPDVREEVVFCLERIPGREATMALLGAYKQAKDDFKPRILAALGHRRAPEAVSLCQETMRSPNREIALAATKAFGRIGQKPATALRFPDPQAYTPWEKTEHMDAVLRFADAQVKQGNHAEAMKYYNMALNSPEEHWQCAAIIGIAKLGTAEAAATIFPKLKSQNSKVRITARQAWDSMKGS